MRVPKLAQLSSAPGPLLRNAVAGIIADLGKQGLSRYGSIS